MSGLVDRRFKRNVLVNYGATAISVAAGFAHVTLVTRFGGVDVYGSFGILVAFSAMLTNLMTVRTNDAVVVFYKRGSATGDPRLCKMALLVGLCLDILIGGLLFGAFALCAPWIAQAVLKRPDLASDVALYGWILLATFLRGTPIGYLTAREHFPLIYAMNAGEPVVRIALIGLVVLSGAAVTLRDVITAVLLPTAAFSLIAYILVLVPLLGRLRPVPAAWGALRDYAKFSLSTFLSSTIRAAGGIDTVVLGYVTNPATVGLVNILRQFLAPFPFLAAPINGQAYPRFVQAVSEHKRAEITATIAQVNQKLRLVALPLIAVLAPGLVGYTLWVGVPLAATDYLAFGLMALTAVVTSTMWWCRPLSHATNPNISLRADILSTLTLVVTVYPLALFFGVLGVALCQATVLASIYFYWRRVLRGFVV